MQARSVSPALQPALEGGAYLRVHKEGEGSDVIFQDDYDVVVPDTPLSKPRHHPEHRGIQDEMEEGDWGNAT